MDNAFGAADIFDGKKEYAEYLKSEHWKTISQKRRELDNNRCRFCNRTGVLQVHHKTYDRKGHEDLDDLITLCQGCHKKLHDAGETLKQGMRDIQEARARDEREALKKVAEMHRDDWVEMVTPIVTALTSSTSDGYNISTIVKTLGAFVKDKGFQDFEAVRKVISLTPKHKAPKGARVGASTEIHRKVNAEYDRIRGCFNKEYIGNIEGWVLFFESLGLSCDLHPCDFPEYPEPNEWQQLVWGDEISPFATVDFYLPYFRCFAKIIPSLSKNALYPYYKAQIRNLLDANKGCCFLLCEGMPWEENIQMCCYVTDSAGDWYIGGHSVEIVKCPKVICETVAPDEIAIIFEGSNYTYYLSDFRTPVPHSYRKDETRGAYSYLTAEKHNPSKAYRERLIEEREREKIDAAWDAVYNADYGEASVDNMARYLKKSVDDVRDAIANLDGYEINETVVYRKE